MTGFLSAIETRLSNGYNTTENLVDCVKEMSEVVLNECNHSPTDLLDIATYLSQYGSDHRISREFQKIIDTHLISNKQMDEWEQEKEYEQQEYRRIAL